MTLKIINRVKTKTMKKLLTIFTIAALAFAIVACNRNPASVEKVAVSYTDTVGFAQFQAWKAQNELMNPTEEVVATTPARTVTRTRTSSNSGSISSRSTNQAQTVKKKGWSKAAKGAVIGAGTGAVLGAVINKRDRVKGAVIGGVLGGGVGFGVGSHMDKKDGRY